MTSNPNELLRLATASHWVSRSISAENFTGAPGAGGQATEGFGAAAASRLGRGWKVSPCIDIPAGESVTLADIAGPGVIRHMWLTTHPDHWRTLLLRFTWDDADAPAIEVPVGDMFCNGWGQFSQVSSQVIAANPHGGFNSYWAMPFAQRALVTIVNVGHTVANFYYQIDYQLGELPGNALYLHGQWRRSAVVEDGTHTLLEGIAGKGKYVGCYLAWQSNSPGWWGEGEMKFYLDDDDEWPTICGTGTEDYFGGAWNFDIPGAGYTPFSTAYLGLNQVLRPDGLYASQQRFGMYRWHIADDITFAQRLRVTVQALGIGPGQGNGLPHRYRKLHDDIASTTWFYLDSPAVCAGARPATPDLLELETA